MRRVLRAKNQRATVWVIEDDHRIELLALGLMHCHHMDAVQILATRQQLVFRQRGIQGGPSIAIIPLRLPQVGKTAGDALTTLEGDQLFCVFGDAFERVGASLAQNAPRLDPVPFGLARKIMDT